MKNISYFYTAIGLLILILLPLIIYFRNSLKSQQLIPNNISLDVVTPTPHTLPEKCDIGVIDKIVYDNSVVNFVDDWIYCSGDNCLPAIEFLEKCNSKIVTLNGIFKVSQMFCDPVPCDPIPDLLGITPHGLNKNDFNKFKDKLVIVEGVLNWQGLKFGPTINVTKIE